MSSSSPATCLVGGAEIAARVYDPETARNPVQFMADSVRKALEDTGAAGFLRERVDTLAVLDTIAWQPASAVRLVAEEAGLKPRREIAATTGGNTPQALVNRLAADIAAGKTEVAVIVGCNILYGMRRAAKLGVETDWPEGGEGTPESFGGDRLGSTDYENAYGLYYPVRTYPMIENAWRARRGVSVEENRRGLGELFAPFTEVAASRECAWFPERRTAEEIYEPSPENRMTSFPYTKRMCAIIDVDQAAAVVLCSDRVAAAAGITEDRRVYLLGGADAVEAPWYITERPDISRCEGMTRSSQDAVAASGLQASDIEAFDLYSCFPIAVEMAAEGLGIEPGDPRPVSLTGGLPFFGGPGNNYSTHALVAMLEKLRENPGGTAMVTGNGWYMTKHAAGVYRSGKGPEDPSRVQAPPISEEETARAEAAAVTVVESAEGPAVIETYTVGFGRDGAPEEAVVMGRLESGERFLAKTPTDPALFEEFCTVECVGRRGHVKPGEAWNIFTPS